MREHVSRERMKQLDAIATKKYHYSILSMMELAGRAAAEFCVIQYPRKKDVLVVAGSGNNGGAGMACARHLNNLGMNVAVLLAGRRNMKKFPSRQLETISKMGVNLLDELPQLSKYKLIVDAMIGYGLKGNLRHGALRIINGVNDSKKAVIAIDIPSGLDANTGEPSPEAIIAKHTLVLAAMKTGMESKYAKKYVGKMHLVDIGIPRRTYSDLRIKYPF